MLLALDKLGNSSDVSEFDLQSDGDDANQLPYRPPLDDPVGLDGPRIERVGREIGGANETRQREVEVGCCVCAHTQTAGGVGKILDVIPNKANAVFSWLAVLQAGHHRTDDGSAFGRDLLLTYG